MSELQRLTDTELAEALTDLGAALTPPDERSNLPAAVTRAIADGRRDLRAAERFSLWPRSRRALALAAAALLLAGAIAAGTKLAIGAIEVRVAPSPAGTSLRPETGPNLGARTTLAQARTRVPFEIGVPATLGPPDGVFTVQPDERVALAWLPREGTPRIPGTPWGAVLMEFHGDETRAVKEVASETSIRQVDVRGARGYWLTGPHTLLLVGDKSLRITGNVLLWERGGVTFRLESLLPRAQAVRLAESMP